MKRYASLVASALLLSMVSPSLRGQAPTPRAIIDLRTISPVDRITDAADDRALVVRPGNRSPFARPERDRGPAPAIHRMERMILVLSPDDSQQEALEALLEAQQNRGSDYYHRWLTPEDFGDRFGASEHDIAELVAWLRKHGFEVEPPPPARRTIVFSGTVAQVEDAFHAGIHIFALNGVDHYANSADPRIPAAFAQVVSGIASLHDFHSQPLFRGLRTTFNSAPEYSNGATHYMAPSDFATIYDVAALYSASVNGTGQSIAIAGRSNFVASDVSAFRSAFGLPPNNPTVVLNGPNPGIVSSAEQTEAELDVEWSGAAAPGAPIQFVLSASTNSTDGVLLSSEYIVNNNIAPAMSLSFGLCEAAMGAAQNQAWNSLWQQAAAEGISVFVAAGDSGAAGCDSPSETRAANGLAVNGLCSSPSSTCVGGTEFSDASNYSQYWSPSTNPTTYGSALGYIPEAVWNESGAVSGGSGLWAASGGASSIYAKPAWQSGPGVPADGKRDVPDVSLSAAIHDGYLFVLDGQIYIVAGTSAATPSFAGLMALVVERAGSRQGNVNPTLYGLAASQQNGGAAVFHDVATGNNSVPGLTGWSAAPGYDLASGLGSVDAFSLVNNWSNGTNSGSPSFALSASSAAITLAQGAKATLQVIVSPGAGFNSSTSLSVSGLTSGLAASFSPASLPALGGWSSNLTLSAASGLSAGQYSLAVTAIGGGITKTLPLAITIQRNCTYSINPASASVMAAGGKFNATVTSTAGCSWNASSSANWLSITAGASGTGNGTVSYTVAANSAVSSRTGSLTIAGIALVITEAGAAPTIPVLSPPAANFSAVGGSAIVTLTMPQATSAWSASSSVKWITITSPTSGKGNATLTYQVAANTSAARTGNITIAGLKFVVTQAGTSCTYGVTLGSMKSASGGLNGTAAVTTQPACSWSAASNANWITITSGATGSGPGTVGFFLANNPNSSARTGSMTIAGYTIQVSEGPKGDIKLADPRR